MKLVDRQHVQGTSPKVYIGHRTYRDKKSGRERISRTWYCEFCHNGRPQHEALKTTNKNAAIREAHQIVSRIEAGHAKKPVKRVDLTGLTREYFAVITNKGRAPKTLEKYQYVLDQFAGWAADHGAVSAREFTENLFWEYRKWLVDQKLAEGTVYDRLIVVKQFFRWAARSNKIARNPVDNAEIREPESAAQPCFTPDQVHTLLTQADRHEADIFATMAFSGLRFGEVRDLQWADLLLQQGNSGYIVVRRGGSGGTTKGKRIRRIPIHPELRKVFDRRPRNFDRIFTSRPSNKHPNGGGPIDERRLLRSLKRLCKRVGFPNPNQYKLHTFRHAFASMCARQNISHKYALEWMGHQSSQILDQYYTMFDEVADAAMATIVYKKSGQSSDPASGATKVA